MDHLHRYYGYTLVDITKTGMLTMESPYQRNQQRNWETIQQILSLRTQLTEFEYLHWVEADISQYSFGVNYTGIHKIWQFMFSVEYADVYASNSDRYGALKDDFKIAPIILGLDETATPNIPLFFASGPDKNIYFKSVIDYKY